MTTVLLADDQVVVRAGVRTLLEPASDIDVVGEAADGLEALAQVARLRPDVALMDIRMPNLNGIDATRRIVSAGHDTKVVILTTYGLDEYVYDALLAGAAGFLLKTEAPERFVDAVRAAAAGDLLLGPATTRQLIDRYLSTGAPDRQPPRELQSLTDREGEVLRLVAAGLSNQETRLPRPRASRRLRLRTWLCPPRPVVISPTELHGRARLAAQINWTVPKLPTGAALDGGGMPSVAHSSELLDGRSCGG